MRTAKHFWQPQPLLFDNHYLGYNLEEITIGRGKSSPDSLMTIMVESNLILNPHLKFKFFKNQDENACLTFFSPTPNDGVQVLELKKTEKPELYELFQELAQSSLSFLDVAEDLSESERNLLAERKILIEPNSVSRQPIFACFLDEVESDNQNLPNLVTPNLSVNTSFHYEETSDFTRIMRRRKHGFEPTLPIVWVTSAKTGITFGYWLRDDYLEIARNLRAGEKPTFPLTEQQIAVLQAAEILVADNYQFDWNKSLLNSAAHFKKEKYAALREILPAAQLAAIRRYFEQLLTEGFMLFNDRQVELRHGIYNDALSIYFHEQLAPLVSRLVGETVKPSYVYSAIYVEDAILKPHVDRPQCEFTMSLQIGYDPVQTDATPWALCLDDASEKRVETFLANGDALVYKGCELIHYREALFKNHRSTSIFFHFVGQDFAGSLD